MRLKAISLIFTLLSFFTLTAQGGFFIENGGSKSDKIHFKLINNLIIIPVNVNGQELFFLLDTGVSKPIVFNFEGINEVLKLSHAKRIYLRGLGSGEPIEAIQSENNVFKIGNIVCKNQDLFVINDQTLNFAPRLGVSVQGVIGYDFFKNFIVEINYSSKYIRSFDPKQYQYKKCKKCETIPIQVHNSKPYVNSLVMLDSSEIDVKMLIDTGGSDALWLFEDDTLNIHLGQRKYFYDFLGYGLSGSVYGKRSKIKKFRINGFEMERPNVAFPDSVSILATRLVNDRNGSISGDILKRFNILFDYPNEQLTLKKNRHFNEKFSYNKSGIQLEHGGVRLLQEEVIEFAQKNPYDYSNQNTGAVRINLERRFRLAVKPAFTIVELRKDSPAEKSGLQIGDIIVKVNGRETKNMELQDVMAMFFGDEGEEMRVKVERNGQPMYFTFELESIF